MSNGELIIGDNPDGLENGKISDVINWSKIDVNSILELTKDNLLPIVVEEIKSKNSLSYEILIMSSFLSEEIPEEIFFDNGTIEELNISLDLLEHYGLITRVIENHTFIIEQQYQDWIRELVDG